MTPNAALRLAIFEAKNRHSDKEYIQALEHTIECLADMARVLRYVRTHLPSREPELHAMITRQLIKGCDVE